MSIVARAIQILVGLAASGSPPAFTREGGARTTIGGGSHITSRFRGDLISAEGHFYEVRHGWNIPYVKELHCTKFRFSAIETSYFIDLFTFGSQKNISPIQCRSLPVGHTSL